MELDIGVAETIALVLDTLGSLLPVGDLINIVTWIDSLDRISTDFDLRTQVCEVLLYR